VILCPLCGAKTHVLETRGTATSVRRRRGCSAKGCAGKATTIEVVVREGHPSLLAKGSVIVSSRQIAKLREIVAMIDSPERRIVKLQKIVAAIEGASL
jgi:transcriptional regulator NrdR family protein